MLETLIDNRNGNVWDISQVVSDVSWKTSRIGSPGSLTFTLVKNGIFQSSSFQYSNGDVVSVRKDGSNVFYGYVLSVEGGKDEDVKITCYDQIRYLLANDTYVLKNVTASELVKRIAGDFRLKAGKVDDTVYRIPTLVEDGQKLLDMICKALTLTLINTGKNYFLFDDFGALSVRKSEDMLLDLIVGTGSLMYDYSMQRSIDSDTYNKIKLYKDNKDTKKREVYMAQDSANMAKWGVLQLYQSVDESMNEAQIKELLNTLIAAKNREAKTLKVDAIGDIRVRAGCYVHIVIPELSINQPFLVDECTHRLDGTDHTMNLILKVV